MHVPSALDANFFPLYILCDLFHLLKHTFGQGNLFNDYRYLVDGHLFLADKNFDGLTIPKWKYLTLICL